MRTTTTLLPVSCHLLSAPSKGSRQSSCQYELQGRAMYPMAGTARVDEREEATGWEPEAEDVRFVGYVVTIRET